ncbi:hypothetical protein [Actinacidiphila sp. bgisy144]
MTAGDMVRSVVVAVRGCGGSALPRRLSWLVNGGVVAARRGSGWCGVGR